MKDNSSFINWFMEGVYWVASKSKDPKTKIGAILVKDHRIISTGYNGIPIGVNDVLYTNALPCADCARGIIQSGISKVYIHKQFNDICDMHQREQWKGHDDVTFTMFNESGVEVHLIDRVLGCKAFFNGKEFEV